MPTITEALQIAVQHHQQGRLPKAEQCYREILQAAPQHVDAMHLLGVVLSQQGKHAEAVPLIQQAIRAAPNTAEFHGNLALALKGSKRLAEAVAAFQTALQLKPTMPEMWHNLGTTLKELNQIAAAQAAFEKTLHLNPKHVNAHFYLAGCLWLQNRRAESIQTWQKLLVIKPDHVEARFNLGNALLQTASDAAAKDCFEQVLRARPQHVRAMFNLGMAHWNLGERALAKQCYLNTVQLDSQYADAHVNLGNVWQLEGNLPEAIKHYRRALAIQPQLAEAANNLGNALQTMGRLSEAIQYFKQSIQNRTDNYEPYYNLGNASKEADEITESIQYYGEALRCYPQHEASLGALVHQLQHVCAWKEAEQVADKLRQVVDLNSLVDAKNLTTSPFSYVTLDPPSTPEEQLRVAQRWSKRFQPLVSEGASMFPPRAALAEKPRLTIGYLSADYHSHATANLIVELFEKHCRERFRLHAYSYGRPDHGPMRQRLERAFDQFTDLHRATFLESARKIYEDEVDILIDLKGYTGGCRPEIVAYHPAPIQVNYLGYPGTMGAEFIDYILVDDYIVPSAQQSNYSEQLVHLPGCYQVNDSRRVCPSVSGTRADFGLPDDAFVFCSLNNNYKITAHTFAVWMRFLHAVPKSVLWLLAGNRYVASNLQRAAAEQGIDPARLLFAPRVNMAEHLARHHFADLFLDTFPVNAHTTASDALWMGCPLLTLAGETFVSRVAGSLLRAVGLTELIATSWDAYEAIAVQLAHNRPRLREIREHLTTARQSSGLFDGARFARHVESAYEIMWSRYASGAPPQAFRVAE